MAVRAGCRQGLLGMHGGREHPTYWRGRMDGQTGDWSTFCCSLFDRDLLLACVLAFLPEGAGLCLCLAHGLAFDFDAPGDNRLQHV